MQWNLYAQQVSEELEVFRRPAFMQRPATLPRGDNDLHAVLQRLRTGRLSAGEQQLAADVRFWFTAMERAEATSVKRLLAVCAALYWSEQVGDNSLTPRIDLLRAHIQSEWGVRVPRPCPDDYEKRCERWAVDRTLFPLWILSGAKPYLNVMEAHDDESKAQLRVYGDGEDQVFDRVRDAARNFIAGRDDPGSRYGEGDG